MKACYLFSSPHAALVASILMWHQHPILQSHIWNMDYSETEKFSWRDILLWQFFLCIYLSWYLFIWISIWGFFLFSVFLVLLFYFASWLLFMYFYDIHLSRDLGQYIFKKKKKKKLTVISILPKNLFHGNTLRILIVTECGNNLYMAP